MLWRVIAGSKHKERVLDNVLGLILGLIYGCDTSASHKQWMQTSRELDRCSTAHVHMTLHCKFNCDVNQQGERQCDILHSRLEALMPDMQKAIAQNAIVHTCQAC